MHIRVYLKGSEPIHEKILLRMIDGMRATNSTHNDQIDPVRDQTWQISDVAVIMWSPKTGVDNDYTRFRRHIYEKQCECNKRTLIIEQPIFRNAFIKFYRVGFDDVTPLGEFANKEDQLCNIHPSRLLWSRWNLFQQCGVRMFPWIPNEERGNTVVVIGQVPNDFSIGGIDFNQWVEETIATLQKTTNRPIVYKPHPTLPQSNIPNINVPVIKTMPWSDVWTAVTYSSGMAVDCALRGIPTITTSYRSWAWDITTHDITNVEDVIFPDRTQWICRLSYAQWLLNEIRWGEPWKRLRKCV